MIQTILLCLLVISCNPNTDIFEYTEPHNIAWWYNSGEGRDYDGVMDEITYHSGELEAFEEMIKIIKEDYPEILEEYNNQNITNPFRERSKGASGGQNET